MRKFTITNDGNGVTYWDMSVDIHVKKSLQVVETKMKEENVRWEYSNKSVDLSFSIQSQNPDIEMTEECNDYQVQSYQSLVGMMRQLCEIGRIDILTETFLLLTYLLAPRVGHLHQSLHVFKYLKDHKRSKFVFDPNYVDITDNHMTFEERAIYQAKFMNKLYPDTVEDLPPNAPNPKRCAVQI